MYGKIVVGWDGSDRARDALALASLLRSDDGSVIAAAVYPDPGHGRGRANVQGIIDATAEVAADARRELGVEWIDPRAVPGHSPAHGLQRLAEHEGADLVVVGSSHRGRMGRVLAGSAGNRLLNGSPCPVAVAPQDFRHHAEGLRVVGVAYDGSEESDNALREGTALARELSAALRLVAVMPPYQGWLSAPPYAANPPDDELERSRRDDYRRSLEDAAASLPSDVHAETTVADGSPAEALAEETGKGMHLLVMGSRNYGPLRHVLVGSTAIGLMQRASCPVLVIPRGASTPAAKGTPSAAAAA